MVGLRLVAGHGAFPPAPGDPLLHLRRVVPIDDGEEGPVDVLGPSPVPVGLFGRCQDEVSCLPRRTSGGLGTVLDRHWSLSSR